MMKIGIGCLRACLLLSTLLLIVEPASASGTPSGRLRGEIKRAGGGRGIAGVTVASARREPPAMLLLTSTDSDGFLAMDDVPLGEYRVFARREGFRSTAVDGVAITGPYRFVVDLLLAPGRLEGEPIDLPGRPGQRPTFALHVEDPRGRAMEGVLVRLEARGMRSDPRQARSNDKGEVYFDALVEGAWRLIITRAGWTRIIVPRVSWGGGEMTVLVRMLPLAEDLPPSLDALLPRAEPLAPSEVLDSLGDDESGGLSSL